MPTPARRALRRLGEQSAWAYLSILCILGGLAFLAQPNKLAPNPIYAGLPTWLVIGWTISVGLGGGFIFLGILIGKVKIERIGHAYLAIAVAIFGLCIVFVGWTPARIFSVVNYTAAFVALVARYRALGRTFTITIPKRLASDDDS